MAYDINVVFSNGVIKTFNNVTKIEKNFGTNEFEEIKNPLEHGFNEINSYKYSGKCNSYRFSGETINAVIYIDDDISIIFIEVRKSEN